MESHTLAAVYGACEIDAYRTYWRDPANAYACALLEINLIEIIEGITHICKQGKTPFFCDAKINLGGRDSETLAASDQALGITRADRLVVIPAYALITPGKGLNRYGEFGNRVNNGCDELETRNETPSS